MKRLTGIVLGMTGAIALQTAGLAQDRAILSAERAGLPPVVETRSELLITEPVSVNGPNQATKALAPFNIYDATRLKEVTESLRAKPGSNGQGFDFLPPDLIHTPSFSSTDNSAIDFFQVPRPDPSVGINFNTQ
jgi:hypothetical protein